MSEELVQGKYAGLYSWRIEWMSEGEEAEVMVGMTPKEIKMLPLAAFEGARVVRTVLIDQVVPFCVKDGMVVLDA